MMNGSFGAQGAGMIGSGGPMMGMAGIHGNTMMHPQVRFSRFFHCRIWMTDLFVCI
jgi:hypothetical protein